MLVCLHTFVVSLADCSGMLYLVMKVHAYAFSGKEFVASLSCLTNKRFTHAKIEHIKYEEIKSSCEKGAKKNQVEKVKITGIS